jgi:hypothetical protein
MDKRKGLFVRKLELFGEGKDNVLFVHQKSSRETAHLSSLGWCLGSMFQTVGGVMKQESGSGSDMWTTQWHPLPPPTNYRLFLKRGSAHAKFRK